MKKTLNVSEIVKIFDLEPIVVPEAESYKFRIEIFKEHKTDGCFYARVYRKETFRMQPTFLQVGEKCDYADEEIWVEDFFQEWDKIKGKTPEDMLEEVIRIIREIFDV